MYSSVSGSTRYRYHVCAFLRTQISLRISQLNVRARSSFMTVLHEYAIFTRLKSRYLGRRTVTMLAVPSLLTIKWNGNIPSGSSAKTINSCPAAHSRASAIDRSGGFLPVTVDRPRVFRTRPPALLHQNQARGCPAVRLTGPFVGIQSDVRHAVLPPVSIPPGPSGSCLFSGR